MMPRIDPDAVPAPAHPNRCRPRRRYAAACAHCFTAALLVLAPFTAPRAALLLETQTLWDGAAPELFITPLLVNRREERGELLLAIDQTTGTEFVEVEGLARELELGVQRSDDEIVLTTPLGPARFTAGEWRDIDGQVVLPLTLAGERLASPMAFDRQLFALAIQLAWPPRAAIRPEEIVKPAAAAEIEAGAANVSFLRTEIVHRDDRSSNFTSALTDTGGSLFGGFWQTRVRDYIEDDPFVEDYAWVKSAGSRRYFLGNQTVSLTTLLGGFEFTGGQMAFANRQIGLFTDQVQQGQLIANQQGAVRTFIGEGPPGGIAELRIEDRPVARDIIALDGRFEFRDIDLPSGAVVKIEVWVFEQGQEGSPVDIQDFSGFNTNQTLPAGTLLVQGGAGVDGNLIEDPDSELDASGFFDAQYALTDRLTFQTIYQHADEIDTGFAALHANLGLLGFASAQAARGEGGLTGWRFELDNRQQHVFWRGFAQRQPDGWLGREGKTEDLFGEAGWRFNEQWQVSLVGRDFESADERFDYLLPAADFRPTDRLLLRGRPDFDGDYTVQGFWRPTDRHDFTAVYNEDESSAQWVWNFAERDNLFVQAIDRDLAGERLGVTWRRGIGGVRSLGFALGVLFGNSKPGFLVQGDYEFVPGLRARAEVFRDPFTKVPGLGPDTVLTLSLVADFSLGGGLGRGAFRRALVDRGAITGAIEPPAGVKGKFDLSGVAILVDNQIRTRTEQGGLFSIPFLPPGLYRVKLDLDGLPLELHPVKDQFWVQVTAGAVSHVVFATELRLGFAGRVSGAGGCPWPRAGLEVVNDEGAVLGRTTANAFGFYRIDGLPPGHYQVRLTGDERPGHGVTLDTEFVFDQDIAVDLACPGEEDR